MVSTGIHCFKCDSNDNDIIDSRKIIINGRKNIRRRRKCNNCNCRFNTYEVNEAIIKRYEMLESKVLEIENAKSIVNKRTRTLLFFVNDLKRFLKEFEEGR